MRLSTGLKQSAAIGLNGDGNEALIHRTTSHTRQVISFELSWLVEADLSTTAAKTRFVRTADFAIGCGYGGKPAVVADNTLDRQFEVNVPDTVWVTDITYIRTHEGWSYLAAVIDLFSRRGGSPPFVDCFAINCRATGLMQSRMTTDLTLQAFLRAVWRRKPKHTVVIYSDQGSQFTGKEWQSFLNKRLFAGECGILR